VLPINAIPESISQEMWNYIAGGRIPHVMLWVIRINYWTIIAQWSKSTRWRRRRGGGRSDKFLVKVLVSVAVDQRFRPGIGIVCAYSQVHDIISIDVALSDGDQIN
jgi:hypothetical protein